MNEFSLIEHFFNATPAKRQEVIFGIGDDAACLRIPEGFDLLVSTDTLVSGVHFLPAWDAYDIACKAVMANISDMAAMAAQPTWITLALTLPDLNETWLESFSKGLHDSLSQYGIDLIGGDTTQGPLSISITIMGLAPKDKSVRRNGAQPGDIICVSGVLGAAALAVKYLTDETMSSADKAIVMDKLLHPKPRVDYLEYLRTFATSAIDISDGLSADLNHICTTSGVGACLDAAAIPVHPLVSKYLGEQAVDLSLSGGDDYELCFTVPAQRFSAFTNAMQEAKLVCYPIGVIEEAPGLRIKKTDQRVEVLTPKGYSHF